MAYGFPHYPPRELYPTAANVERAYGGRQFRPLDGETKKIESGDGRKHGDQYWSLKRKEEGAARQSGFKDEHRVPVFSSRRSPRRSSDYVNRSASNNERTVRDYDRRYEERKHSHSGLKDEHRIPVLSSRRSPRRSSDYVNRSASNNKWTTRDYERRYEERKQIRSHAAGEVSSSAKREIRDCERRYERKQIRSDVAGEISSSAKREIRDCDWERRYENSPPRERKQIRSDPAGEVSSSAKRRVRDWERGSEIPHPQESKRIRSDAAGQVSWSKKMETGKGGKGGVENEWKLKTEEEEEEGEIQSGLTEEDGRPVLGLRSGDCEPRSGIPPPSPSPSPPQEEKKPLGSDDCDLKRKEEEEAKSHSGSTQEHGGTIPVSSPPTPCLSSHSDNRSSSSNNNNNNNKGTIRDCEPRSEIPLEVYSSSSSSSANKENDMVVDGRRHGFIIKKRSEEEQVYEALTKGWEWEPPALELKELESEQDDDHVDWLFNSNSTKVEESRRRSDACSFTAATSCSSMWPKAQWLPGVHAYALPYTIPF